MYVLRELLDRKPVHFDGEFVKLHLDPPRISTVSGRSPLFYFVACRRRPGSARPAGADVFLMWPDTEPGLSETMDDMKASGRGQGPDAALRLAVPT